MAASPRKTFAGLLFSTPTLVPVFLGLLGAALILIFWDTRHQNLAEFLAIAGGLGGLGTLLTLLLLNTRRLEPALVRKRRELLACLEELADGSRFTASAEADQPAVSAQTERV